MSDDEAPHDSNSGVLPPFVSSLYELVQDPATKHIVSFLPPSSKVLFFPKKKPKKN
jgi:hypothetical protein